MNKLKPDGALLVFVTTLPRSRLSLRVLRRARIDPFDAQAHHYQFTYETARCLLEWSGFRVASVHVPSVPGGLSRFTRSQPPRLFFEARPTADAQRSELEAERRNRAGPTDQHG